MTMHNSFIN